MKSANPRNRLSPYGIELPRFYLVGASTLRVLICGPSALFSRKCAREDRYSPVTRKSTRSSKYSGKFFLDGLRLTTGLLLMISLTCTECSARRMNQPGQVSLHSLISKRHSPNGDAREQVTLFLAWILTDSICWTECLSMILPTGFLQRQLARILISRRNSRAK